MSSRPTTKDPAERETEWERRDPDDARHYYGDSGVLPRPCPGNRISLSAVLRRAGPERLVICCYARWVQHSNGARLGENTLERPVRGCNLGISPLLLSR